MKSEKGEMMARLMKNPEFRQRQWDHRYDHHIAPINQYVDTLRKQAEKGSVPYVPPMYGGINARLLSLMRDPGPMTQDAAGGSGFICMENDDPTAERISNYFAGVHIPAGDIVPWNAYPWYINRKPRVAELEAGVLPLKGIIDLLPNLCVVMLHGGEAKDLWKRLLKRFPEMARVRALGTYHTSAQAFWTPDPTEKARRKKHLVDSFIQAAEILQRETPSGFSMWPDVPTMQFTGEDVRTEPRVFDIPADTRRNVDHTGRVTAHNEGQKSRNISEGVKRSWENQDVREKRLQHHAVKVHRNGTFVGDFSSLYQAFKILGLPVSKHIPFRKKLKQDGRLPFNDGSDIYDFEILPPI
ncbi:MAG: uracil-DNA glycosylase [Chlorobium sp.]|nr:uracil-DNA glycosylase [Chlorobium sp.]